jgi:hypothetical protein
MKKAFCAGLVCLIQLFFANLNGTHTNEVYRLTTDGHEKKSQEATKKLKHYETAKMLVDTLEEQEKRDSITLPATTQQDPSSRSTLDIETVPAPTRTNSPELDLTSASLSTTLSASHSPSTLSPARHSHTSSSPDKQEQTSEVSKSYANEQKQALATDNRQTAATQHAPQFLRPLRVKNAHDAVAQQKQKKAVIARHGTPGTTTRAVRSLDQLLALPIPNHKLPPLHRSKSGRA